MIELTPEQTAFLKVPAGAGKPWRECLPKDFVRIIDECLKPGTATRPKTRFILAWYATMLLYSGRELTVRQLFAPPAFLEKEFKDLPPPWVKEGLAKAWQRTFLNRLIEHEYIGKEGHKYYGVEIDTLERLMADTIRGGSILKHFLWPNEYPIERLEEETAEILAAREELEREDEEDEEGDEETPTRNDSDVISLVEAIAEKLSVMADGMNRMAARIDQISETVDVVKKSVEDASEMHVMAVEEMKNSLHELKVTVLDQDRMKLVELTTALTDARSRYKSIYNQLESVSRKEETALREIEALAQTTKKKLESETKS